MHIHSSCVSIWLALIGVLPGGWIYFPHIYLLSLTCTLVEFAGLRNVAFAEPGPLSDRRPDSIDVITGRDCVQEDASVPNNSKTWAVHFWKIFKKIKTISHKDLGETLSNITDVFFQSPQRDIFLSLSGSYSTPGCFIDHDNLSWVWSSRLHGSHGDAPMNDRHVQTEHSEWGLSTVPSSVEPAPECQRKRPL